MTLIDKIKRDREAGTLLDTARRQYEDHREIASYQEPDATAEYIAALEAALLVADELAKAARLLSEQAAHVYMGSLTPCDITESAKNLSAPVKRADKALAAWNAATKGDQTDG